MDCKDKGSDVQEEHSIHRLIGQAMKPPDMKHMRHRQRLNRTDRMSASRVFSTSQRPALEWQSSLRAFIMTFNKLDSSVIMFSQPSGLGGDPKTNAEKHDG